MIYIVRIKKPSEVWADTYIKEYKAIEAENDETALNEIAELYKVKIKHIKIIGRQYYI